MKKITLILLAFAFLPGFSCTKERGYKRELEGTWEVSRYEIFEDSIGNNLIVPDSQKIDLYFNRDNGFVLFFEHLDSTNTFATDTLIGTATPFIDGGQSALVMTYHPKSLTAHTISERPVTIGDEFNTEIYSILHLNNSSMSLTGYLREAVSVDSIILQAEKR